MKEILLILDSLTHMGLKNADGVDIKDVWKAGIKSYLGMTFEGFPNCFMIYSPHGKFTQTLTYGDLFTSEYLY